MPDRFKATATESKILPKRLAQRLLPSQLDMNRKQGFSIPLAAWLDGPCGKLVADVLHEVPRDVFDRRLIGQLLRRQKKGYSHTSRLFALTMFELWRRHYNVEIG